MFWNNPLMLLGKRVFFIFLLSICLNNQLFSQEAAYNPADSLLAAGDSLGANKVLDSISERLIYVDQAQAMIHARQGLTLARSLSNPEPEVIYNLRIAEIYFVLSDFLKSLEYALIAEQITLEKDVKRQLGNVYNTIGNIFFMQKDWEKALKNWEKSLEYRRKYSSEGAVAGSLNNIAKVLTTEGQYDKAKAYLDEARAINIKSKHWRWEAFNLMNYVELSIQEQKYSQARNYALEGLELTKDHGYEDGHTVFMSKLAELDALKGHKLAALERYREILKKPLTGTNVESIGESLQAGAELAQESGNLAEAYALQTRYITLQDSLHQEEIKGKLANIEVANEILSQNREEEFKRRAIEIEQEEELSRARLVSYIYLMGLGILLVGASGLLYGYLVNKRRNKLLSDLVTERTDHLEESNQQLNTFIYKSSHDLYGPVKTLQGLLPLVKAVPSARDTYVGLMEQKINQLEAELRNLIQTMELRNSPIAPVALDLQTEVRSVLGPLEQINGFDEVAISIHVPSNLGLVSDKWNLNLILRNALENAIHFRSPDRNSVCRISAEHTENGANISISDNGVGISTEAKSKIFDMFFRGSHQSPGSGLGLYNVRLAIEKIGGTIAVVDGKDHGTAVQLFIPNMH